MAKSLLSMFGKATTTGLTALALTTGIGVGKAEAGSVPWGPNTPASSIVVTDWQRQYGIGQTATYSASSVNITDTTTGQPIPNNMAWSLIYTVPFGGSEFDIGIINGVGTSATGFFSSPTTLSDFLNSNSGGRITGGIDINYSLLFGVYADGLFTPDPLSPDYFNNVSVAFNNNANTFSIIGNYASPIPEPVTGGLLIAGALTALACGRRNQSKK